MNIEAASIGFMTLSTKNRSGNLINSRVTTTETQSVLTLATASNTADKNVNLKIHHLEVIKQKTSSVCKESQCLFTIQLRQTQLSSVLGLSLPMSVNTLDDAWVCSRQSIEYHSLYVGLSC